VHLLHDRTPGSGVLRISLPCVRAPSSFHRSLGRSCGRKVPPRPPARLFPPRRAVSTAISGYFNSSLLTRRARPSPAASPYRFFHHRITPVLYSFFSGNRTPGLSDLLSPLRSCGIQMSCFEPSKHTPEVSFNARHSPIFSKVAAFSCSPTTSLLDPAFVCCETAVIQVLGIYCDPRSEFNHFYRQLYRDSLQPRFVTPH